MPVHRSLSVCVLLFVNHTVGWHPAGPATGAWREEQQEGRVLPPNKLRRHPIAPLNRRTRSCAKLRPSLRSSHALQAKREEKLRAAAEKAAKREAAKKLKFSRRH